MKRFVIDTCVLIDDPDCITKFGDNEVVLPFKVIEELDKHKNSSGSRGEGARAALRNIYNLGHTGKISKGIKLDNGGLFRVDVSDPRKIKLPLPLDMEDADNAILAIAFSYKKKTSKIEPILVTNDINLRIKSEALELVTEKYENRTVKKAEDFFSPYFLYEIDSQNLDTYVKNGEIIPPKDANLYPNQPVLFKAFGTKQSALGKYNQNSNKIEKLKYSNQEVYGIKGKNLEQRFAIEFLMDDNLKLVNLIGKAGTGKTLLSLAAGLQKVLHEKIYNKIVIARPVVTLSKSHELGFLPGSLLEKTLYLNEPFCDSLEVLMGCDEEQDHGYDKSKYGNSHMERLLETGKLEVCALAYIRGRNIDNAFVIIDEAQNLLSREHKAIITRMGSNSKIVMTGDPFQTDHQYLDEYTNGLSYVVEKFKSQSISAHAVLRSCERSALSGIAADIL